MWTGTRNIVELCLKHRVQKLVYVSSTSVIPELPEGQVIREISDYSPDSLIGYYAQTKALATELVMEGGPRSWTRRFYHLSERHLWAE